MTRQDRLPAPHGRTETRETRHDCVLELLLLSVGMVPWCGYSVRGAWDQTELGLGLLLMMPAFCALCTFFASRRRAS